MIQIVIIIALVGYCFQLISEPSESMIFSFYGLWLRKLSAKGRFWKYISKPLGSCIICNTVWIGLIVTLVYYRYDIFISLMLSLASAGLANLIQISFRYVQNHLNK